MPAHRRYTHRQKATAVIAAEMSSMSAVAEQTGIPLTTLDYWMDRPEFVALRKKTREEQADAAKALAGKVLGEIERRLPEFDPKDLSVLYGILTDKGQLLAGEATTRSEHRELLNGFDDGEREAVADFLRELAAGRLNADA